VAGRVKEAVDGRGGKVGGDPRLTVAGDSTTIVTTIA
jgi:hypothetical protein